MSIYPDSLQESLSEEERHTAFKDAQASAYAYARAYERAYSAPDREELRKHAELWAQVSNALRRDHV